MKAYSTDLRQKIVHAYQRRLGSQRALADLFGVSASFVEKLWRRNRMRVVNSDASRLPPRR